MDADPDKKYLITASPSCFYPDRFIEKAYEQHSDNLIICSWIQMKLRVISIT